MYMFISLFILFCFGLFAVLFRDDDINTYITLARNEWNSVVSCGGGERQCRAERLATRSSFFEWAPALSLFSIL
jgi:hypothetical protein